MPKLDLYFPHSKHYKFSQKTCTFLCPRSEPVSLISFGCNRSLSLTDYRILDPQPADVLLEKLAGLYCCCDWICHLHASCRSVKSISCPASPPYRFSNIFNLLFGNRLSGPGRRLLIPKNKVKHVTLHNGPTKRKKKCGKRVSETPKLWLFL